MVYEVYEVYKYLMHQKQEYYLLQVYAREDA